MENQIVSTAEVKRYFLLADFGKRLFNPLNITLKSKLDEDYKRILDEIYGLSDDKLDEKIKDKIRLSRYNSFKWHKGFCSLEEVGPWPEMRGIDPRLTKGNVLDMARSIREFLGNKRALFYSNSGEKIKRTNALKHFLEKSESMIINVDFIYEKFPIILFPGREIREKDYNAWARENDLPLCEIFDYDLDDGSSRAVSYALTGIARSPCFFGI